MYRNILILILLFFSMRSYAQPDVQSLKVEADSAYVQEKYEHAAKLYNQIAAQGYDAKLCYNLGCTYFRLNQIARSVLWFERAAVLAPDDGDVRFNLSLVRTKTIDRITPRHEMFFVSFYRGLVNMLSLHKWAWASIALFVLFLVSLSVYLYSNRLTIRKISFSLAIVFFLFAILSNICGFQQRVYAENRTKGVIMVTSVNVKSTPAESGNDLFVLHEGTCFDIEDDTMNEWAQIRLVDGKVGWIQKKTFERI